MPRPAPGAPSHFTVIFGISASRSHLYWLFEPSSISNHPQSGDFPMRCIRCLSQCVFAASLLLFPAAIFAADDTPAAKAPTAEKTPEPPPNDVTTQGSVDVKGQHILYSATVGIITVGANDTQDGQLGMDGKPLPGSELAISEPKEPKAHRVTARTAAGAMPSPLASAAVQ